MKLGNTQKFMIMLSLFLILISSGAVSSSGSITTQPQPNKIGTDAVKLTVVTRHDTSIQNKYAEYFAKSDLAHSVGITSPSEIEFKSYTTYSAFKSGLTSPVIGASVGWGGGPTLFNNLASDGALRTIDDTSLLNWIDANVSDTIAGANMKKYDSNNNLKWVAAAISSFGFTVNNKTLQERGLPFPTTWEDLASPAFYTSDFNIAMGNAPDTTSNTRIYQIILQKYGWEKGWQILYSMAGNAAIYGGSVETRAAVERGDVAVAMTIDFYGVIAAGVNNNTQYVIPEGSSIVNGDPIAISSTAPDLPAARAFVKYVLSDEGQALWTDNRINRLPVRFDAFDAARKLAPSDTYITNAQINTIENLYNNTLKNQGINFDEDLALSLEEAMRYHFEATITNVHSNLRDSWAAIATNYNGGAFPEQRLQQLLDIYGEPAINQTQAQDINAKMISDATFRQNTQGSWEEFATSKYLEAKNAVDDDYQITGQTTSTGQTTVVTTDSSGNTVTTTSDVTVTSDITQTTKANTVDNSVKDFTPIATVWVAFGLIISPEVIKFLRKHRNK